MTHDPFCGCSECFIKTMGGSKEQVVLNPIFIRDDWTALDTRWYSQGLMYGALPAVVGIVLTKTGHGHKVYVGIGLGLDAITDIQLIAMEGCRMATSDAKALWPDITDWAE